jgi:hypothetical protein
VSQQLPSVQQSAVWMYEFIIRHRPIMLPKWEALWRKFRLSIHVIYPTIGAAAMQGYSGSCATAISVGRTQPAASARFGSGNLYEI